MCDWQRSFRLMMAAGVVGAGMLTTVSADERPADDAARRSAAVALNYSRAAFHRIRRNPSLRVLEEEQEKILNHLNLNEIADEEVLKLYSSVLDEIAQIQLADRERELLKGKHRQQFQSQLAFSALALSTQMATAQFTSAVKTGATSWWDFRNFSTNRDLDLHRIDKERMNKLVEKSSKFLDVSWKMARDRQIPDRWLVRGDDLDQLETAWQEPDPTVRLRVLKRMEPFMECYPPYWYYVARTEQALGQMSHASQTYQQLAVIGKGHFRKDEMLAAGLANRALILAYLQDDQAPAIARQALAASSEVWEANLICASVLQRHHDYETAEDAILRNLDVELESEQSRIALVTLYHDSNDRTKLAQQMSQLEVVKALPANVLAQCAAKLGETETPPLLAQVLERSLQAAPRYNLGRDDLVIQATSNWQLERASRIALQWGEGVIINPKLTPQADSVMATFEGIGEFTSYNGRNDVPLLSLSIEYPDAAPVKLTLQLSHSNNGAVENSSSMLVAVRRPTVYRVAKYEQEQVQLAVHAGGIRNLRGDDVPQMARPDRTESVPSAQPVGVTSFRSLKPDDPYFITPEIEIPLSSPLN